MDNEYFNIDEAMVEYAEMSGFDFKSGSYLACCEQRENSEYSQQPYTFKYGNFDLLDMLKSMFYKTNLQKI